LRRTCRIPPRRNSRRVRYQKYTASPAAAERRCVARAAAHEARAFATDGAHPVWFLPAGSVSAADGGYETYTLVQNPNASDVKVRVSYMKRDGKGNVVFTGTVPAGSRTTYNMGDRLKEADASIMVECLTPSRGIIVERSMYMMGRWSGTDTVGAHSD